MRGHQRALAGTVRPDDRDDLARADRELDRRAAPRRARNPACRPVAVSSASAFSALIRCRRDRLPAPPGRAAPPPARPSAIFWPKSITTTRSARPMTKSMSCSTSRIVIAFRAQCAQQLGKQRFSCRRSPAAGSSSSSRRGSRQSARAISTMRCWPSGSAPAVSPMRSPEPDAPDLPRSFREQPPLPPRARDAAWRASMLGMAALVHAERDILEHAAIGHQPHVLEGARDAEPRDAASGEPLRLAPEQADACRHRAPARRSPG